MRKRPKSLDELAVRLGYELIRDKKRHVFRHKVTGKKVYIPGHKLRDAFSRRVTNYVGLLHRNARPERESPS